MNFDLVLANPPFAGELKDKKMLQHYYLAQPALRRAKDKQPKEERDVIFIERIINLLRPGGRAAVVLPQGKFNNSSLAFIREFILHKARLLAVVGLHVNTFKPHTPTKTSVLVIQKYTEEQLAEIERIKQKVSEDCPDYEQQINDLIEGAKDVVDIDEALIPEEILAVLNEEFPEEEEEVADENNDNSDDDGNEQLTLEEKIEQAEQQVTELKQQKLNATSHLQDLKDKEEALAAKQKSELEILAKDSTKDKKQLAEDKKAMQAAHKAEMKALKDSNKAAEKQLKAELKMFEKQIPLAEEDLLKLTLKGRLQIIHNLPDVMERLRSRYVDAEVAKRLDYPIFMAVSEHGGKNNSGDYEYMRDVNGNFVEDAIGNPEIDQDLVNHEITRDFLKMRAKNYSETLNNDDHVSIARDMPVSMAAESILPYGDPFISEDNLCIAEAFVKFAVEQGFDFWKED